AVSDLAHLLKEADRDTADAATTALGQIGGTRALQPLISAFRDRVLIKESMPRGLTDAVLRCADDLLAQGKQSAALTVFKELYKAAAIGRMPQGLRMAAYAGAIRASGKRGLQLELAGLQGSDPDARGAALQLASDLDLPGLMKALTDLLPQLEPQVQAAVIESLQRRGDPGAATLQAFD